MLHPQLVLSLVCALFCSAGDRGSSVVITPDASPNVETNRQLVPTSKALEESVLPTQRLRHDDVVRKLGRSSSVRRAQKAIDEKNFKEAIDLLEGIIDQADANPTILDLLEKSYRQRLSELVTSGNNSEASLVAERLRALTSGGTEVAKDRSPQPKPRRAFREEAAE